MTVGVLALGLALGACTGQSGSADDDALPDPPEVSLMDESNTVGIFDGGAGAASLAASRAFFASSPAAVVLALPAEDSEQTEQTGQAAAAAAGLGIPLLVAEAGSEQQVASELDRLGTESVIVYGTPPADGSDGSDDQDGQEGWSPAVGERTTIPGPVDSEGFQSLLGLQTEPAAAGPLVPHIAAMERQTQRQTQNKDEHQSVLAVPGLDDSKIDDPAPEVPAANSSTVTPEPSNPEPPEPTNPEPPTPATPAPSQTGTAAPEQLPPFQPAGTRSSAVVLATDEPTSAAAVATARAAGAHVQVVDTADPRADSDIIALLRRHAGDGIYAVGEDFGGAENFQAQTAVALNAPELPGGGQTVFPGRRMVALYGHPGGGSLGVLGEQGIEASVQRAKDTAAQYQPYSAEPVVPALEIITTVASAEAGDDGDYSTETPAADLLPWIEAAQDAGVYVVLDLQPGLSSFPEQALRYEELLKFPHVGLALDAEWRLEPGQRHLEQIGAVDADEVNQTADWLAALTREHVLPQKVLMLHQFNMSMIRDRGQVTVSHPELAVSLHADGHGTPEQKQDTWNILRTGLQPGIWPGWKNFYDEDTPTLTPEQTFTQVSPKPWFISYQ